MFELKKLTESIEQSVLSTMENIGFMDARYVPEEGASALDHTSLVYSIHVILPSSGKLYLYTTPDLGTQIIQNIYGTTPENLELIIDDTFGEFLNVIAGKILQLMTPNRSFEIGLPIKEDKKNTPVPADYHVMVFKTPSQQTFGIAHDMKHS